MKECSCQGRNPHCDKCNGFGMIRPQPEVESKYSVNKRRRYGNPKRTDKLSASFSKDSRRKTRKKSKIETNLQVKREPFYNSLVKSLDDHFGNNSKESKLTSVILRKADSSVDEIKKTFQKISQPSKLEAKKTKAKPLYQPLLDASHGRELFAQCENQQPEKRKKAIVEKSPLSLSHLQPESKSNKKRIAREKKTAQLKKKELERAAREAKAVEIEEARASGKRRIIRMGENNNKVRNSGASKSEVSTATSAKKTQSKRRKISIKHIVLENKEGYRCSGDQICSACGEARKTTYQYMTTSGKKVYICTKCKPIIFERSFGTDAMDLAVQGGMFECNRRRH